MLAQVINRWERFHSAKVTSAVVEKRRIVNFASSNAAWILWIQTVGGLRVSHFLVSVIWWLKCSTRLPAVKEKAPNICSVWDKSPSRIAIINTEIYTTVIMNWQDGLCCCPCHKPWQQFMNAECLQLLRVAQITTSALEISEWEPARRRGLQQPGAQASAD